MPPKPSDGDQEDYELLLPPSQATPAVDTNAAMGQDEMKIKPEWRTGDNIAYYVGMGASIVTILITWAILLTQPSSEYGWFSLHTILQPLAMTLFTYGVLTLQPTSQPKTKVAGLSRHQLSIFILGFPLITIGTLAVVFNKIIKSNSHFQTWHAIFGITCMGWIIAQIGLGGGSVWFRGALFGGGMKAKQLWRYHRISGYVLFILLLLSIHIGGMYSHWAVRNSVWVVRFIGYTLCPTAVLGSVVTRIRLSKMNIF